MKVLHIVAGLDTGGVAMLLYQYLSHLQEDLKFDFIIHEDPKLKGRRGRYEEKFEALESHIHKVVPKKESLIKNLKQVSKVMESGKYDAVHIHNEETSAFYSTLACFHKISVRVVHSHYAYKNVKITRKLYNSIMRVLIKITATNWLACSRDAGIALYGKKAVSNKRFSVLYNAIDIGDFTYSEAKRREMRAKLKISDESFVIIDVGRLTYQKNPERAIEIFNELYKKNRNALLLMVGIGEFEDKIVEMIQTFKLEKNVWLLGSRNDVNELLQASDVFLMPTRFEGLGIVYVEAQAVGLHTFGTAGKIPKEAKVCDLLHFCADEASPEEWAAEIWNYSNNDIERNSPIHNLQQCGYDIKLEAAKLLEVYKRK